MKRVGVFIVIIVVYVDDLVIVSNDQEFLNSVKRGFSESFAVRDLGELYYFFGIKVDRDRINRVIFLSQEIYV